MSHYDVEEIKLIVIPESMLEGFFRVFLSLRLNFSNQPTPTDSLVKPARNDVAYTLHPCLLLV
jgi:hypothetical protein